MIFFSNDKNPTKEYTNNILIWYIKMINCINMLSEKYQRFTPTKILRFKVILSKNTPTIFLWYENSIGTEYKKNQRYAPIIFLN